MAGRAALDHPGRRGRPGSGQATTEHCVPCPVARSVAREDVRQVVARWAAAVRAAGLRKDVRRATAGEIGARFISVGLADVLDMWLGQSERNLHQIFRAARQSAPVVLFFDEIDALGRRRSQLSHGAGRNVVNQLLAELDGVEANNEGVFVLGATNHPWDVDTALLRPGRFDRTVLVLPPDRPAREAIIRHHLKGRPVDRIDVGQIAAVAPHSTVDERAGRGRG